MMSLRKLFYNENFRLWVVFLSRLVLGSIFIFASLDKIKDPGAFSDNIENYLMLKTWMVNPFAVIIPSLEFFCGLLLILGIRVKEALLYIFVMLGMFIIALTQATMTGINTSCGCFSSHAGAHPVGWDRIFQDLGMVFLCFVIYFWSRKQRKILSLKPEQENNGTS